MRVTSVDYDQIAIDKARQFLENLEVFTKLYYPKGEIVEREEEPYDEEILRSFWIKFVIGNGDNAETHGFKVRIALDEAGRLIEKPRAKSWTDLSYIGQ